MSYNQKSTNDFSPEVLKSFVEVQKKKIENEGRELSIREKEIASNERLALKSMELQADLLKERPKEMRKSITMLAYIVMGSVAFILLFLGWLVYRDNKDFAVEVIDKGSYLIVAILSYIVGKKNGKSPQDKTNDDSDIEKLD